MQPKVKAHCSYIGTTGYNNHSRDFFRALSEKVDLQIRNFTIGKNWEGLNDEPHNKELYLTNLDKKLLVEQTLWNSNNELEDFPFYKNFSNNFVPNVDLVLNEVDHHFFYHQYSNPKIAYTVWESTLYPPHFFEKLKEFDQVWVPSKWQAKCSIKQGLNPNKVKIVPEGVDVDTFKPTKFKQTLDYKDGRFKFLLFGRWDYRKSTQEIIETFLKEFSSDEPVDLIVSVDNPYSNDGLSTTEERLFKYNLQDSRIKVKHFPSREDYITFLQNGHVFVSCARSEGWNLPLIEAMACGTPSIYSNCSGQLEFAQDKGFPVKITGEKPVSEAVGNHFNQSLGNYYEPDFIDLAKVMRDVYENYDLCKKRALNESKEIRNTFTWENAASIGYQMLRNFNKNYMHKNTNKISTSFIEGAQVEINGSFSKTYLVKFFNHKTNELIWEDTINNNMWTSPNFKYFIKWRVEIWSNNNKIEEHIFDCTNKKVYIHLDSKSLGDTLAWFPYVEEFRKLHKCKIVCSTFHNDWFSSLYPKIEFVEPSTIVHNLYAMYRIGWFYNEDNTLNLDQNVKEVKTQPLQKTASDILGLQYKEIKPKLYVKSKKRNIKEKYVVIAPHGTKHASYWNYRGGWQSIVDWLANAGYKVVMISQEKSGDEWQDSKLGGTLQNITDKTGNLPLQERFTDILNAEAFIGIGSGLSWVSWALDTPTVLISGFSDEYTEFQDCERITASPNVCSGCFNTHKLDAGDWEWCPHHKNTDRHFECSKSITPDLVANALVRILN
jgi:autotransporter strand-loop-strand O-heptosyltransferase